MTIASSPTLRRVAAGNLCTGCGLCAGIAGGAVTLEATAPGFPRPRQLAPIEEVTERRLAQACPAVRISPWQDAPQVHEYWGPWYRTLTGHATWPGLRHSGSSGGVVTGLAIHALQTGLVSRVLHVAADPDHPTRNVMRWSERPEDVVAGAGSRYSASSPLAFIDAALAEDRPFAFIGKPCDVSALRALAAHDARVEAQVPVMLSFYCAGVPSYTGADRVIRAMGIEPEAVTTFRYRGNGWPGLTVAETAGEQRGEMRYAESWGRYLSAEVQFRCKICPDGVGGHADIACADAWHGSEDGYPLFEEEEGRSLIMSRTDRGEGLLRSAEAAGLVVTEPLSVGEIDKMQPHQARRKRLVSSRMLAARAVGKPVPVVAGLKVEKAARRAGFGDKLRNFLGTARRVLRA